MTPTNRSPWSRFFVWLGAFWVANILLDILAYGIIGLPHYEVWSGHWWVLTIMGIAVGWKAGNDAERWWIRRGVHKK